MIRRRRIEAPPPLDFTVDDKIAALWAEEIILKPYASTKGLPQLKERLVEIRLAIHKLHGLPLEELDA